MKLKTFLIVRITIALLVMNFAAPHVLAQNFGIISLKVSTAATSYQNEMFTNELAGAPGVRTNYWNNLTVPNGAGPTMLTNNNVTNGIANGYIIESSGNVLTNVGVTWYLGGGGSDGWFNRANGVTNDGKMYGDVADVYNNTSFANFGYLDVTNIPYTNYEIYCYFRDDNGNGGSGGSANTTRGGFWLITNTPSGAQRYYIQNQSNDVAETQIALPTTAGAGYVISTTTSIPSGGTAWSSIQGGNYAEFTGLTNSHTRIWFGALGSGNSALDDLGNYVNGGATARRFKLPAFQIVQIPPISPTNLYFVPPMNQLHAGSSIPVQTLVEADSPGIIGAIVTSQCTFTSATPSVVTVTPSGALLAGTNGTGLVYSYFDGLTATDMVTVIGPTSLSISIAKTNLTSGVGVGDTTVATLLATYVDATNIPVNTYSFVSFTGSPNITITANGTITAVSPGPFSVTGNYDQMSVTTNNIGIITAFQPVGSVPALSVNFTLPADAMSFHDLSGAPGSRVAYWNNMASTGKILTNTIVNPVDYHGNTLSGVSVSLVVPTDGPNAGGQTENGVQTTNESQMFDSYFDQGSDVGLTTLSQIDVTNVPYSSYDVYLYFYNDNSVTNRPAEVIIDGVTQYRNDSISYPNAPDNTGNGYVQAFPQPSGLPASVVNVPYGNYVKFTGVTDSNLVVQWASVGQDYIGDANAVTRTRLSGFQIVKSLDGLTATNIFLSPLSVPPQLPGNPATYSLLVEADFTDGTTNGNITGLAGLSYSSSNPSVFTVDTNGVITPGTASGTANLVIVYTNATSHVSYTNAVTTLAPTSVQPVATPDTVYQDGYNGETSSQLKLLAIFPGYGRVDVSTFTGASYDSGNNPTVATISGSTITPQGPQGVVGVTGYFEGLSGFNASAYTVTTNGYFVMKHRYSFRDAPGSTNVLDSVGNANGTIFPALSGFSSITLDGENAIFPGQGDYTTAPYIALPPGTLSSMNDVTIDVWYTVFTNETWARIFDAGVSAKGTNPHNTANGATPTQSMIFAPADPTTTPRYEVRTPAGNVFFSATNTPSLPTGVEYHVTLVYSPNQEAAKIYVNGVLNSNVTILNTSTLSSIADTHEWMGVSGNDDAILNGSIDEFRLYEGVMSDAQVAADDAAGPNVGLPPILPSTPTNIVFSVSGSTLQLSWPANYTGWILQAQTNASSIGLSTNWFDVTSSTNVDSENITINPTNGAVFYRLVYP